MIALPKRGRYRHPETQEWCDDPPDWINPRHVVAAGYQAPDGCPDMRSIWVLTVAGKYVHGEYNTPAEAADAINSLRVAIGVRR